MICSNKTILVKLSGRTHNTHTVYPTAERSHYMLMLSPLIESNALASFGNPDENVGKNEQTLLREGGGGFHQKSKFAKFNHTITQ